MLQSMGSRELDMTQRLNNDKILSQLIMNVQCIGKVGEKYFKKWIKLS